MGLRLFNISLFVDRPALCGTVRAQFLFAQTRLCGEDHHPAQKKPYCQNSASIIWSNPIIVAILHGAKDIDLWTDPSSRIRRSETRNLAWAMTIVRRFVAAEYEPATDHEMKMPINIGRSAFPA